MLIMNVVRRRHEANHNTEPLFQCCVTDCRKPFQRSDLLARHMERQCVTFFSFFSFFHFFFLCGEGAPGGEGVGGGRGFGWRGILKL